MIRPFLAVLVVLCLATSLFGAGVKKEPTKFTALPTELLHYTVEYLDYEDWLALYYALGKDGARVRNAIVPRMVILSNHLNEPIPQIVISIHASIESIDDLRLVTLRLRKVLRETKGIKSLSLDGLPINNSLLELIRPHRGTLERLSISSGVFGGTTALKKGWLKWFTHLKEFEFFEPFQQTIAFPADFEPLTNLVYLNFEDFDFCLSSNAFLYLGGLKYLRLRVQNGLPNGLFEPLDKLRTLDIMSQEVRVLGPESFKDLSNLRTLVLPKWMARIDPCAFSPLKKLTTVKLAPGVFFYEKSQTISALRRELGPLGFILYPDDNQFVKSTQVIK